MLKLFAKFRAVDPHPACQHRIDPVCHLRRARFRERQTKDLRRINMGLQQQPQNARGKNLGLSCAGRGGQPDAVFGCNRRALVVLEGEDCTAHADASS